MRKNDKRSRLVLAADALFHRKGVTTTTLANIAELSEVPLGNVYYYFKSKESIVLAVVQYRKQAIQQELEQFNTLPEGIDRLKSLLDFILEKARANEYGDPLGSLCQELSKQVGKPAEMVAELMQEVIRWVEKQLKALGKPEDKSYDLAAYFIASLQGIHLLGLAFRDPALMQRQCNTLLSGLKTI